MIGMGNDKDIGVLRVPLGAQMYKNSSIDDVDGAKKTAVRW